MQTTPSLAETEKCVPDSRKAGDRPLGAYRSRHVPVRRGRGAAWSWLHFEVEPEGSESVIQLVFRGMLRKIPRAAVGQRGA
jgi:hypothetical protein